MKVTASLLVAACMFGAATAAHPLASPKLSARERHAYRQANAAMLEVSEKASYGNPLPGAQEYGEEKGGQLLNLDPLTIVGFKNQKLAPPTKLQTVALAVASYGKGCGNDHPGMPGNWGEAHASGNKGADSLPHNMNNLNQLMERDHRCIVRAAADEYLCEDEWNETKDGAHHGSYGELWLTGDKSLNDFANDHYRQAAQYSTDRLCVISIRGTDDFPGGGLAIAIESTTGIGDGGPDFGADNDRDIDDAEDYTYYNMMEGGSKTWNTHHGFRKYFKDRVRVQAQTLITGDPIATSGVGSGHDCQDVFTTGHSLGGVMAHMLSIYGIALDPQFGGMAGGGVNSYSIGSLPFIDATETRTNQQGFRLWHEQDFAPNLSCAADEFYCVNGSTRIDCKQWGGFGAGNSCQSTSDNKGDTTWEVNEATKGKHSNYCNDIPTAGKCEPEQHGGAAQYAFSAVYLTPKLWTIGDEEASANEIALHECNGYLWPMITVQDGEQYVNDNTGESPECPSCCTYPPDNGFDDLPDDFPGVPPGPVDDPMPGSDDFPGFLQTNAHTKYGPGGDIWDAIVQPIVDHFDPDEDDTDPVNGRRITCERCRYRTDDRVCRAMATTEEAEDMWEEMPGGGGGPVTDPGGGVALNPNLYD